MNYIVFKNAFKVKTENQKNIYLPLGLSLHQVHIIVQVRLPDRVPDRKYIPCPADKQ